MSNSYAPQGPNAGYIPADNPDLLIGYARNVKSFKVPLYCPIKPVDREIGLYKVFNPSVNYRFGANWKTQNVWAPLADRPSGVGNQVELGFVQYQTQRYDIPVLVDDLTVQQSNWPVEDANAQLVAQKHMTLRTLFAYDALSNATWGSNSAAVDAQQGSSLVVTLFPGTSTGAANNWSNGTTLQPNIAACLLYAARQINIATGGAVPPQELCLLINPNTAVAMSLSPEIRDTMKQSIYADQLVTGAASTGGIKGVLAEFNANWNLPWHLSGFPIVIEDAVYTTEKPGANPVAGAYVMADNEAYLVRRPANLDKLDLPMDRQENVSSGFFPIQSTLCQFTLEEMTSEAFPDPRNRRTDAHIASNYMTKMVSAISGYKFTHVTS